MISTRRSTQRRSRGTVLIEPVSEYIRTTYLKNPPSYTRTSTDIISKLRPIVYGDWFLIAFESPRRMIRCASDGRGELGPVNWYRRVSLRYSSSFQNDSTLCRHHLPRGRLSSMIFHVPGPYKVWVLARSHQPLNAGRIPASVNQLFKRGRLFEFLTNETTSLHVKQFLSYLPICS